MISAAGTMPMRRAGFAGHNSAIGNVTRDHRTGADQGILADRHSRAQDAAAADPGGAQNTRRTPVETEQSSAVADALIVHGHNTRTAKHLAFNDDAARQIATALQRHQIANAHVAFDIDKRADGATLSDDRIFTNEDEIANSGVVPDLRVI